VRVSVVNTMFPVSASAGADEHEASPVLFTSLSMVFLTPVSSEFSDLWMIPAFFGKRFLALKIEMGSYGKLAPLLILYAITREFYSLSSVIITYEMSRKIANTVGCSWLSVAHWRWGLSAAQHAARSNRVQLVLMIICSSF